MSMSEPCHRRFLFKFKAKISFDCLNDEYVYMTEYLFCMFDIIAIASFIVLLVNGSWF